MQYLVAVAVVLLLAASSDADEPKRLPDIDYIGCGYDIIMGNPHSPLSDPGFAQAIFQLNYNLNTTSADDKWLLPDHVESDQTNSCSFESETHEITGTGSYQESLSVDAALSFGVATNKSSSKFVSFKFSGSAEYKQVSENTHSNHRLYASSNAKCSSYVARNTLLSAVSFTDSFHGSVKDLPLTPDKEAYLDFISVFGTHFLSHMVMGAKFVITSEFYESDWMDIDNGTLGVSVSASLDLKMLSGSLNATVDIQHEAADKFDQSRLHKTESYLGSKPPKDGKWETWAENAGNTPYPISYALKPITDLFKAVYFPDINLDELRTKRRILQSMYEEYCGTIENCGTASSDRVPLKMEGHYDIIVGPVSDPITLTCNPGFWLLSCALSGMNLLDPESNIRGINKGQFNVPSEDDKRSCNCSLQTDAEDAAYCYVWCVNRDPGLSTSKLVSYTNKAVKVPCETSGYKVTSCSVIPLSLPVDDDFYTAYAVPTPSGDGCMCMAGTSKGVECRAHCAPNIVNYEVQVLTYASSDGWGIVECSGKNVLLGCAVNQATKKYTEYIRSYHRNLYGNNNRCQCHSGFPGLYTNCYAICGQFV